MRRFLRRLLSVFRSDRAEHELAREITAHLQILEDQFVAQGMSAVDARFAARRAFGGVEQVKEHQRDARSFRLLDESWLDLELGARMLVKYPGLTLVAGLGMSVAIAIGAVFFSIFYTLMAPTLPLDEGDRIVGIENWDLSWNNQERRIVHDFDTWRREVQSIQDIGAFRTIDRNLILRGEPSEPVRVAEMTAAGFRVARVAPLRGRPLLEEDEREGAPPVVVVGYDVWQNRFLGDAGIVGRAVQLGSVTYTVVGVMPEGFGFPINHGFWVPLRANAVDYPRRRGPELFVFGRLAPDVTLERAQAELTTIGRQAAAAFPETHERLRPRVVPYTAQFFDDMGRWDVLVGQFVISLLLVVVSVNVTILVYARTATRQGEIAVRTALGASRRRIVAQLFMEALMLSTGSAVIGLVLATLALKPVNTLLGGETGGPPFWANYGVSFGMVLYATALACLAAAIVGVLPALQATGRRLQLPLRQLGGGTAMELGRTWTALIVVQVAFSAAILPIGVITAWEFLGHATFDAGFPAEEFLTLQLTMDRESPPRDRAQADARAFASRFADRHAELVRRLESAPGVADVTYAWTVPGRENQVFFEAEGVPAPAGTQRGHDVGLGRVALDFFEAFNAPILAGRGFHAGDFAPGASAAIVNRSFVQQVMGGGNALGRRVRDAGIVDDQDEGTVNGQAGPWFEIVGVVADLPANSFESGSPRPVVYRPLADGAVNPITIAVRARGTAPVVLAARVREITTALDPTLRLTNIASLDDIYRRGQREMYVEAMGFGVVALSVVLLSAAGIYALMSFTVARRRREIGIRAALGADARRILSGIFARALGQLAIGLGVGLLMAALLDALTDGELMRGHAAAVLPSVAGIMLTVGLLAAVGPARRGLNVQPTEALREE